MKILIVFSTLLIATLTERARFDQYQVHRLVPENEEQIRAIRGLQRVNEFNFWTELGLIGRPVDIMVPPHKRPEFAGFLERNGMRQQLFIKNVQELIDEEQSAISTRAKKMDWDNYHSLEEIYEWLDNLTMTYKNVKKVVVGKTYEKRDIYGIEITFGAQFRTVFIESGIHAREWIAAASTSWVMNEILKSPSGSIWQKFNYIYVPFYNPDGYAFSWTTDRMWRKTRTPYKTGTRVCYGADPNRNWAFQWKAVGGRTTVYFVCDIGTYIKGMLVILLSKELSRAGKLLENPPITPRAGTSNDPCSEIYCGPQAFSEIEMKTISEFLTANAKSKKIDVYLDFHSYSQLIMYPSDYTAAPAPLSNFWQKIGEASAADLKAVNNETFLVGGGGSLLYPTAGTSLDWFYSSFNSTITYLWELRDKGYYGFLLPAKFILPSAKELYASVQRVLIEYDKLPPKNFS